MKTTIAIALALLSTTANAELRTWEFAGTVENVSGFNLPVPVIVGDTYVFSFTFDDATPAIQYTDGCASYVDPVQAMAVRVGEHMVANPINGSVIIVCDDSAAWLDSFLIAVTGAFDVSVELSSVRRRGPLKSTAIPSSPPKGLPIGPQG